MNTNINLPIEFENRMKNILQESYPDFLASFCDSAQKAVQLNDSRMSASLFEASIDFPVHKIDHLTNAYYFGEEKLGGNPFHHAGVIYSQDPSAMLPLGAFPSELVNPDWNVLDLCAAPGGKTFQIASLLSKGTGILVSNEINPSRNKILTSNVERMGYKNILVTKMDSQELSVYYPGFFDLIVVDAPCSGEGMFRKYPESVNEWSPENVVLCSNRQKEILANALLCLKPGGYLIYSTCTYSKEENEDIIDWLLSNYPMKELPVKEEIKAITSKYLGNANSHGQRSYPHKTRGEGQFFCHLKLEGELLTPVKNKLMLPRTMKPITKANLSILKDTMKNSIEISPDGSVSVADAEYHLYEFNDMAILLPNSYVPLPSHGITQCGILAGSFEKKRFIPHHQLFHCFGEIFYNQVSLPSLDERISLYLKGNEIGIDQTPNGYGVIKLCSKDSSVHPENALQTNAFLGGFKASNGRLKNHYPKGLRNF